MRVLIVRIGALGDVLHAMPAVAALRALHPDWFIGWAIEPRWSDLLQIAGDPEDLSQGVGRFAARAMVDRWYRVTTGKWKRGPFARETRADVFALRKLLRSERFDLCVDMQGSIKSAVVGRMAGARLYAGAERPKEWLARWLYRDRIPLTTAHMVTQGCELVSEAVGEALRPATATLPINETAERWAAGVAGAEPFCLISPGGGWASKVWPAERFGQLAATLGRAGMPTLVNAPVKGSADADRVVAMSEGYARAIPCTIGQLISLTRRASVMIASDTGPLHLAAALERPVVAIFGPTDPARNGPYATRSRVLRDPAGVTSYKHLSETDPAMLRISVEEVVAAALELLG